MSRHIIFLRFPAFPWRLSAFRPDAELARYAALYSRSGVDATVLDFATVEQWERIFPQPLRPILAKHWDTLRYWPPGLSLQLTRQYHRKLPATLLAAAKAAGLHAADHPLLAGTDAIIVVRAASQFEYAAAEAFAVALRRIASNTRRILVSPFSHGQAHRLIPWRIHTLYHVHYSRMASLPVPERASSNPHSRPELFARQTYPGLHSETHVKLFDISGEFEHSVRLQKALGWATRIADVGKPFAIGRADWAAEAAALHHRFGVRTFYRTHETGGLSDWAGGLQPRLRQTGWQYGMTVDGQFEGEVWARAHAAGCRALAVQCRTGSQRLLEKACGPNARVYRQTRLLQTASNAGCFTHALFDYPTPADDYHTRDETLRFIEKTNPDGISVTFPNTGRKHTRANWSEHLSFLSDVEQRGASPAWSADERLALRAGEAASGLSLAEETNWALATGDGAALSVAVKHMNRGLQSVLLGPAADSWRDAAGQG